MQPSDLSFCTTAELIGELMRRTTFMGIVVHSEREHRGAEWGEARVFKVHFSGNLARGQAGRLLEVVAEHIERASDSPGL
jgi:hypothetical protein